MLFQKLASKARERLNIADAIKRSICTNSDNLGRKTHVSYTYHDRPYLAIEGDHVRIMYVTSAQNIKARHLFLTMNIHCTDIKHFSSFLYNQTVYIEICRPFYNILKRFIKVELRHTFDIISKVTMPFDELFVALKFLRVFKQASLITILGTMTIMPFILRFLSVKTCIVYDPLSNYAQTLHLRCINERKLVKKTKALLKLGLFLAVYKLQLKASNRVLYPSSFDMENAIRMFKLDQARVAVLPNPIPIKYENEEEYKKLRMAYRKVDVPHFILLAGSRGRANYKAVKTTVEVFNQIPSHAFILYITGPWGDLKYLAKNPSVKFVGVVSEKELKALIAAADYGLSPVFDHAAGTLLKVLSYLAGGLSLIATPQSLAGIEKELLLQAQKIFLIRSKEDYKKMIERIVSTSCTDKESHENAC